MDKTDQQSSAAAPRDTLPSFQVTLRAIFWVFFQMGALGFGGGLIGWLYHEAVARRHWLTEGDFVSMLTLGQTMPGVNIANHAIYVGQKLRGLVGSCVALFALLVTPFFLIIGLASVYAQIGSIPWVHDFMGGVATSGVALLLSTVVKSIKRSLRNVFAFAIFGFLLITIGFLGWPMVTVTLSVLPISIAMGWLTRGGGHAR